MDSRRPSKTEQALALMTAFLTLAAVAWQMIPEHDRRLAVMRTVQGAQRLAARAAAGLGREGMRNELCGSRGAASQQYGAALHLSMVRDALGRTLERMKP